MPVKKMTVLGVVAAALALGWKAAVACPCGDGICEPGLEDDFSCPEDCGSPDECEPDECTDVTAGSCLAYAESVAASPEDVDAIGVDTDACLASGGNCHCDDECSFFGDCCVNACEVCGACGPICGDGACGNGETATGCPADCLVCGDGTCVPGLEDLSDCPEDCG